ncbi:MAG: hypothetical protein J6P02_03525 [Lachnospiraceae bacterium]|nr:hypothetical protein [Lachnospiraceae bacterium]
MKKTFCDRCGNEIKIYFDPPEFLISTKNEEEKFSKVFKTQLCSECKEEYIKFTELFINNQIGNEIIKEKCKTTLIVDCLLSFIEKHCSDFDKKEFIEQVLLKHFNKGIDYYPNPFNISEKGKVIIEINDYLKEYEKYETIAKTRYL